MRKPEFVTAREAVARIQDGDTFGMVGMTLSGSPEEILKEMERSFMEEGHPRDLTFVHAAGISDKVGGMNRLGHEGMLKRVIGSHWGLAPNMMDLIANDKVEAFCMPLGVLSHLHNCVSRREPGLITKTGLGTFVDPRYEGGKMNELTKDLGEDLIQLMEVDGEEYLNYKYTKFDYLIIRGTYADEAGNISTIDEGCVQELLPAVLATKKFGGKVIVQVRQKVAKNSIPPKEVTIPGVFVDYVVVSEHPFENHRQSSGWYQDDTYSGQRKAPFAELDVIPLTERKVIGRRAMMQLEADSVINVGTGIPNDTVGPILAEEKLMDDIMVTVESGIYGGVPAGGMDFGISQNAVALIPVNDQFDFYEGAGVDFTFMGCGELDAMGNVNATKMGKIAPGSGGFVDITSAAKNVIFCSTFMGKGLKVKFDEEKGVEIVQEGKICKVVKEVLQVSFNGRLANQRGQNVYYVTERCVFKINEDGPVIIEVARGIDLQRDILDKMEFTPKISPDLKEIPTMIYREGRFGLKDYILS
ncbi:MAG: CoA-transferase [Lachnospiraceae bacterium]|nr:CoA-transferase [Lachnospiraceae bacterium]